LPGLLSSILQTVDETPMMPRALELAFELGHPVYDCAYLALAETLDQQLVTADERFLKRVRRHAASWRVVSLNN
jgi:predicted nucleic acid-binding protein